MRLLIVNPNTSAAMTRSIRAVGQQVASSSTAIECLNPATGPAAIESTHDAALATGPLLNLLAAAKGRHDAVVIACCSDPGLYPARELLDVPVIGICEAALLTVSVLASRFSVVTSPAGTKPRFAELVASYGFASRLASIQCAEMSVLDLERDPKLATPQLLEACRQAIGDGAEAIVLGCAAMGRLRSALEQQLGLPVIDGVAAAVKLAEAICGLGLAPGKVSWSRAPQPIRGAC